MSKEKEILTCVFANALTGSLRPDELKARVQGLTSEQLKTEQVESLNQYKVRQRSGVFFALLPLGRKGLVMG